MIKKISFNRERNIMYTGTNNKNDIPNIVKSFLNDGYTNIEVTQNSNGQWIIVAKG
jgi:hypothetical protein